MGKGRKGFERVGNESEGQTDFIFHMMLVWTHVDVDFSSGRTQKTFGLPVH